MIDFYTIRNHSQLDSLIKQLRERRLPYNVAIEDIYPLRSIEFNNYLWGVVYETIARETGQTPEEVHEACKKKYNVHWEFRLNDETKHYEMILNDSTATLNTKEFIDYVFRVRVDAEIDLHITIPMPKETFCQELNFETEL